jgi:lipopolysaccharide/colanic/teichoic acid biosynthesis glycosyltransferase
MATHPVRPKQRTRTPVYNEEMFTHLMVRERKRSERSNRPFIVLTLTARTSQPADGALEAKPSRIANGALEAAKAASRDTDIVGWVTWPTVVGIIFSEIGDAEPTLAVETVRGRVLRELGRRLDPGALRELTLEFRVYPHTAVGSTPPETAHLDPLLHVDLHHEQRRRKLADAIKRTVDIAASFALLLMLSPLLLVVALAIKWTSPGPILFKQVRLGKWGVPFKMLKFRSMYVNAGDAPHYDFVTKFIKESGRSQASGDEAVFKLTDDPRITRVGNFIRKTSIDELPQLWNVLIGEMSLVGPRPPLPYELAHYAPWHRRRVLEAKPGITGLWQVTGRSRTTFDDMVRLDLRYARSRSLWTDLRILLRTPGAVVGGKGAR